MAKTQAGLNAYRTLISMMNNQGLKYTSFDDNLRVELGFNTDDFDIKLICIIDEERELVRIFSFLPFKFPEDKRVEGAIAATVANHGMVNGSFDFDISDGEMTFKCVNSYKDGGFNEEIANYMVSVVVSTVDNYNDRFFGVAKGMISIQDFMEKENR